MTPLVVSKPRPLTSAPLTAPVNKSTERPSRLLASIYHDIGMAAVAMCLDLPFESLEPAVHESVRRGSRYIFLMPKREDASQAAR
jgi:hypothetical protein